ncbi:MAG: DUF4249 domain-containing protein [Bacteroidota bacterium]
MIRKLLILFLLSAGILYQACKKPFDPETIQGFSSALIVEGVINPTGVTNITLSRTLDLDDKVSVKPELKANVQVVADNNTVVTLLDRGAGLYSIPQINLNSNLKYRLKITTSNGRIYESDAMAVKNTPAMDSLYWRREPNGVGIYVDTHDSQNKTKYYQWDFEENWELRSIDEARYKVALVTGGGRVESRDPKETALMQICYKSQRSTAIDIFSTASLTSDVVSKHPIVFIKNDAEKLAFKYSILVRQYALTFEAFEYLSQMKKNSEQLGSFFDSQPTELVGNIRNVSDRSDIAIGFITIAPVIEKRIFITKEQLGNWGFKLECQDVSVKNHPDSIARVMGPGSAYMPQYPIENMSGSIVAWGATSTTCLDCRTRGGNNDKPTFW